MAPHYARCSQARAIDRVYNNGGGRLDVTADNAVNISITGDESVSFPGDKDRQIYFVNK